MTEVPSRDESTATITLEGAAVDVGDVARTFARRMAASSSGTSTGADVGRDMSIAVGHMVDVAYLDERTPVTLTMTRHPESISVSVTMPAARWDDAPREVRSLVAARAATEPEMS